MQETAQQRPLIQLLERPGEENQEIESIIESTPHEDFSRRVKLNTAEQKSCAPCDIYRMPFEQSEMVVNETDDFYVVDTEDRKGHTIRNMGVTKAHGVFPAVEDSVEMIDQLVDSTATQVIHEYQEGNLENPDFILYGSMNTFSEHFHLIASDIYGTGEPEDLRKINSYLKFEHDGEEYDINFEESILRDSFGKYLEGWAEETERFDLE